MSGGTAPELQKLAHQLGIDSARLDFLADVPVNDLRTLRAQIGERLFQADKHHFSRIAALSKAVPVAVSAKVSQLALPPLLAARTSELLEPKRAVEMVSRLPAPYLADVAAAMDPGRSPEVVAAIPAVKVALVGTELARRSEWVVMGAFVSYVSREGLRATVAELNGEQLLRVGYVLDDSSRLGEITEALRPEQLDEMLAAAIDCQLWRELDDVLADLDDEHIGPLAERFATAPDERRAAVTAAVENGQLSAAGYDKLAGN